MNMCPAVKHDMDVVGIKRRSDRGPNARPVCRGCDSDGMRKRRQARRRAWELPEAYDLDTGELIIDDIAIERAVNGGRIWVQEHTGIQPWITETEARIAAERMFDRGYEPEWIADNIGCTVTDIYLWLLGAVPAEVAVAA